MIVGSPKEVKNKEFRVGITPSIALDLKLNGHRVIIEKGAGLGAGFSDKDYFELGAEILQTGSEVFEHADMIVKVKEPQKHERHLLRQGQILFTYLHLAADHDQTSALVKSGVTAIAYETITSDNGGLPLLSPMSEVAGRLAPQVGASAMQKNNGGNGILLGGVPGVAPASVVIIGGGIVGTEAAKIAAGMGANVIVLDKSLERLKYLDEIYNKRFTTLFASSKNIAGAVEAADMIIGAVLVPGASAPKVLKKAQLPNLKKGSVLVDVAIDQGGCFESSYATTHDNPTYFVNDILHYCVANMPGAVPRTSTIALSNATMPYIITLANKGWRKSCLDDIHLCNGLNVHEGKILNSSIADALSLEYVSARQVL